MSISLAEVKMAVNSSSLDENEKHINLPEEMEVDHETIDSEMNMCPKVVVLSEDENRDLREFAILDETDDSESDAKARNRYEQSDSEEELPPESVEDFLKSGRVDYCEKEKLDMDKFVDEYEDLPPGWIRKEYHAGIPFYIHVSTNIVSTTRPYQLGEGSIKKHKLCLNAMPCLNFFRRMSLQEKENEATASEKNTAVTSDEIVKNTAATSDEIVKNTAVISDEIVKNTAATSDEIVKNTAVISDEIVKNTAVTSDDIVAQDEKAQDVPSTSASAKCRTDSVQKHASNFLTHKEAVLYFKKLYRYKTLTIRKFSSWKMKRAFVHKQKCKNKVTKNLPAAPEGTIVVSVPMLNTRTNKLEMQDWSLNPKGKSYVCILHEYLQRAVKTHPVYDFKELENAKTPYLATIKLNDMQYGNGMGSSKKIAKLEAAKATLEILLPQLKSLWNKNEASTESQAAVNAEEIYSLFDTVEITDPMVTQYCKDSGESPPYSMLRSCIEKNFDADNRKINQFSKPVGKDKFLFTMEVDDYSASVKCKSIHEGRHLASQKILQQMHPQVHYLGSLLRLYGNAVLKGIKEKKLDCSEESKAKKKKMDDAPNFDVLRNLREAMNGIYADRKCLLELGGFEPPLNIDETVMNMYKEMKAKTKSSIRGATTMADSESIASPDSSIAQESTSSLPLQDSNTNQTVTA